MLAMALLLLSAEPSTAFVVENRMPPTFVVTSRMPRPPAAGIDGFEAEGAKGRTDPPPAVIFPAVTVDRTGPQIEVYGFTKSGIRVGYYLPPDASNEQVRETADRLRKELPNFVPPKPMPAPVVPAVPFAQAPVPPVVAGATTSTQTISATSAVASSRSSVGSFPTGNTFTGVPVGMFGNTSPFGSVPCGPTG